MVPENHVLDRIEKNAQSMKKKIVKADRTPKCNVFMSAEFYKPSKEQKLLNK